MITCILEIRLMLKMSIQTKWTKGKKEEKKNQFVLGFDS